MPLPAGTQLGPYEIVALIGAGGMGEVYKARDTRLDRIVAIKTSKEQFSERFEREARAVAALNHPNICTLFDVGPNYLVMEYIEGPTLAERIQSGAIPLAEALPIAHQIVEALEAAHEKGIVHRDLKPANVKITPEGKVKVLDFGLAKAFDTEAASGDPASSPTLTISATRAGMILGTASYMSPEQARGHVVDKRADIWAFGVVLLEMLTGRQTFAGETISDTLASVLKTDPNWSALPPSTPQNIRRLLRRCLERDRKQRLRDIGDARLELDDEAPAAPATGPPPKSNLLPWGIAALLLASAVWLAVSPVRTAPPEPSVQSSILPPEKASVRPIQGVSGGLAISPDGRILAFVALQDGKTLLWVRRLDSLTARPLPGTENAYDPFWSPDSRTVGFFSDPKIKKVDVAGGPVQVICDATAGRGGTWSPDGTIVFSLTRGLFRVPATGGTPVQILGPGAAGFAYWPRFLPDGSHFLYVGLNRTGTGTGGIFAASTDQSSSSASPVEVVKANSASMYSPRPGGGYWLLYARQSTLVAQKFDAGKLKVEGEAVAIAEHMGFVPGVGFPAFSVSQTGVLVYGDELSLGGRLTWLNREGNPTPLGLPSESYVQPRLSPDGTRLAVAIDKDGNPDIWQIDLVHGIPTRFTFDPAVDFFPIWSPDGRQIAFVSMREGRQNIYLKAANGAGAEETIVGGLGPVATYDWSRDGRYIIHLGIGANTGPDLFVYDLKERKDSPLVQTQYNESQGQFSPDGRWVAYSSDESGRYEVYVIGFPSLRSKYQISANGGGQPRWRGDGKELYYISPDGKMMVVGVKSAGESFERDAPRVMFESRALAGAVGSGPQGYFYDVTRDGQRFLIIDRPMEAGVQPLTLITNWQAGLKK